MAGEGIGGSVGELEMAAWLQQVVVVLRQVVEWARWWGRKKSRVEGRRWASYGAMEHSRPLLFAQGPGDSEDV